jgi:hypothetical protein
MYRRRIKIKKIIENQNIRKKSSLKNFYDIKSNNIAFIIPVTSRKRNYNNINDIDFFKYLYSSFNKNSSRDKYNYSFYLGYDDDDLFYIENKEKIINFFNNFGNKDKIFLIKINGLQGKVGEIWSKLADIASIDNDFLYQIGDDITLLTDNWEELFISDIKKNNFIGVTGPDDINNSSGILTQSFVHVTHLSIFKSYFPKEIKNWYIDDWITNVYDAKRNMKIKVRNCGGEPRYKVDNNKNNYKSILEKDKLYYNNILQNLGELPIKGIKGNNNIEIKDNILYLYNNRIKKINIHFITYGDNNYDRAKQIITEEAKRFYNFKSITAYSPNDLDKEFKEKNNNILKQSRGGGYWIWKPYLIYKKLNEIEENDYLLYLDAGCRFNDKGLDRFLEYIEMLKNSNKPIISFVMSHQKECWWTNDNIFNYFNIKNTSEIANNGQIVGGIKLMKKCNFTEQLYKRCLDTLDKDNLLFTDEYNKKTNRKDFRDNRHDQSIVSIISKIEGSIELEDETYFEPFGNEKSLKYPFWACRKKS